jgi:hypothetical protein
MTALAMESQIAVPQILGLGRLDIRLPPTTKLLAILSPHITTSCSFKNQGT